MAAKPANKDNIYVSVITLAEEEEERSAMGK